MSDCSASNDAQLNLHLMNIAVMNFTIIARLLNNKFAPKGAPKIAEAIFGKVCGENVNQRSHMIGRHFKFPRITTSTSAQPRMQKIEQRESQRITSGKIRRLNEILGLTIT